MLLYNVLTEMLQEESHEDTFCAGLCIEQIQA